jgi:kinesin family protein 5
MTKPLNEEVRIFDFDRILGASATQEESYNRVASKIVSDVMSGYNGTIMAYGQTGSGKTFTIFGKKNAMDYSDQLTEDMGIVPRAIKQIFNTIRENSDKVQFQVRVSFMQVYIEQITDLIQDENDDATQNSSFNHSPMVFTGGNKRAGIVKDGLQIREDPKSGIFVKGLRQIVFINK